MTNAINTSRHEITGYTPYFINFGREHILYGKCFDERVSNTDPTPDNRQEGFKQMYLNIYDRLQVAHEKNRSHYNLRRRHVDYQIGQKVWRKNKAHSDASAGFTAKFAPKFLGPFLIKRKTGYCTYELQDDNDISKGVWHVQDLKAYDHDPG